MQLPPDAYAAPHGLAYASQVANWTDAEEQIGEYLGEVAAFASGGDPPGALARAHWIRAELSRLADELPPNEPLFEELRATVEQTIEAYRDLLREWQDQNESRHAAYLERERAAIERTSS